MGVGSRISAVTAAANDFLLGDWRVQPRLCLVSRDGESHHIEPKTMEVLECLAAHAGAVVLKEEIIAAVWPDVFVSDHVLTHAVSQLRQAFGSTHIIDTVPRRGYRVAVPVQQVEKPIRSLLVLPFASLSADPEQEFFVDGMTDALIGALAQVSGLRVISRTSAMCYKDSQKPLPEIAHELNIEAVVEGSVARVGGRLRFTVQLIRAATDEHLWAKTFDRDLSDVLELQDEVVRNIAAEVRVTLTADEQSRLGRSRTVNPSAHEAYLKGRYCYFRMSEAGLRLSLEHMRNAIAADDSYAPAYSGLANSAAALNRMSLMAPDEANAIIRPAIARALELDPSLAEAHCMLGGYRLYSEWDWPGAEQSLRQAITLNPSSSVAYGGLAELYEALDRNDDAVRCWTEACHFDPLSVFFPTLLGGTLVLAGRPAQAAEQLRATLRQEPHFWLGHEILGFALADLGRYAEAIEAEQTAVQLSPDVIPKTALGYIYARAGLTEETRRLLQELEELSGRRYVSPLVPAALLTALGDCDQALDHLERGCVVRDPVMVLLRSFPFWRSLHDHPRYQQIVRSMNFPD